MSLSTTPPVAPSPSPAADINAPAAAMPPVVVWSRAVAVGSLLGLIVLGLAWELVLAPTGNRTLALKVLPLAVPLVEANRAAMSITSVKKEGTLVEITFPPQRVLA
eukprot:gene61057-83521_t